MTTVERFLMEHHADHPTSTFARQYTDMAEVWDACPRADKLLWIIDQIHLRPDARTLQRFACWCVRHTPVPGGRTTWGLVDDRRCRIAVKVAERHAAGEASKEEMTKALSMASDAAWDATWGRSRSMASKWARDAVLAAVVADAGKASRDATRAASDAAADDADWTPSWSDVKEEARSAARAAQANHLREIISNPFRAVGLSDEGSSDDVPYSRIMPTTALEAEVLAARCENMALGHPDARRSMRYRRQGEAFRDQALRLRMEARQLKGRATASTAGER